MTRYLEQAHSKGSCPQQQGVSQSSKTTNHTDQVGPGCMPADVMGGSQFPPHHQQSVDKLAERTSSLALSSSNMPPSCSPAKVTSSSFSPPSLLHAPPCHPQLSAVPEDIHSEPVRRSPRIASKRVRSLTHPVHSCA